MQIGALSLNVSFIPPLLKCLDGCSRAFAAVALPRALLLQYDTSRHRNLTKYVDTLPYSTIRYVTKPRTTRYDLHAFARKGTHAVRGRAVQGGAAEGEARSRGQCDRYLVDEVLSFVRRYIIIICYYLFHEVPGIFHTTVCTLCDSTLHFPSLLQ